LKLRSVKIRYTIVIVLVFALFNSCSTKKNTFTRRLYHNLTARYNAYFNGNESFKTGVVELEKLHIDDYSKVLPVFKLGTAENATSLSSYFDKAFTKASKVITRHSIFIKNKEHIRWVPEAYLLVGKSYFYKQEYKLAAETFDYIVKTYPEFETKYPAMLWLARANDQLKKYEKAESTLDFVQEKMDKTSLPKVADRAFPLAYADYHIKQENYQPAIEYLISGIEKNRKKSVRARLRFILAQIYQYNGNLNAATELYKKVIKMNPPYVMAFNAKINEAICYDASTGSSKEIKKLLNKMIKDTKNKDYLDQIYYALAEICMKENDTTCAISNYKLSADKSVSNNSQKALSFLKLAKLYYSRPDYENAEAYYDSTMTVLPKDYPDYKNIATLDRVLKDLVKNIRVVQLQDSLQKLSKMSVADRNKIIDGIITDVIKEEQKKQQEEYQKQLNISNANANTTLAQNTSSWYFYNPNSVNFGKTEFIKKWGNRKLEDLWRLSNKQMQNDFGTTENTEDSTATDSVKKVTANNLKDKKFYLKNIPVTADDIKKSNDKIANALFNIGTIYQNDLKDLPKAIDAYDDLVKRFPDNKDYNLKTYYQLYLVYDAMPDDTKRDYYKNLICSKEPESDYCSIIKDPNFHKVTSKNKDVVASLYQETFDAFKAAKWDTVINKANQAIAMFKADTTIIPKFIYLKAVSYGKNKDSLNFVKTLQLIITKYPSSIVAPKARDLLDFYTGKSGVKTTAADSLKAIAKKGYTYDENAIHLYVMIVNLSKSLKISDLKNLISDYNTKNFSTANLSISNIFINNTQQMVTVTNFPNKEKAMLYYNDIKKNKDVFSKLKPSDCKQFVISVDNYPALYKNKDVDNYYLFFTKNYLN
jgi:tetratricopeptide (TPR) repeat protein